MLSLNVCLQSRVLRPARVFAAPSARAGAFFLGASCDLTMEMRNAVRYEDALESCEVGPI